VTFLLAATLGAVISFYVRSSSILEICFMDEMKYTVRRQRKITSEREEKVSSSIIFYFPLSLTSTHILPSTGRLIRLE